MMAQGQLIETFIHNSLIQSTTAHFGTHRARILFLTVIKNNGRNFRFDNGIGDFPLVAQRLHSTVIHAQTHINGNGFQLERLVKILLKASQ